MEQSTNTQARKTIVSGIPSADIPIYWPHLRERLAPAVEEFGHGEYAVDDLLVGGLQKQVQFWVISTTGKEPSAVGVTRVIDYPRKRVCMIVMLVGEKFDEWGDEAFEVVGAWAKSSGCTEIQLAGRKGWTRKLAPKGWHETLVTMTKEL